MVNKRKNPNFSYLTICASLLLLHPDRSSAQELQFEAFDFTRGPNSINAFELNDDYVGAYYQFVQAFAEKLKKVNLGVGEDVKVVSYYTSLTSLPLAGEQYDIYLKEYDQRKVCPAESNYSITRINENEDNTIIEVIIGWNEGVLLAEKYDIELHWPDIREPVFHQPLLPTGDLSRAAFDRDANGEDPSPRDYGVAGSKILKKLLADTQIVGMPNIYNFLDEYREISRALEEKVEELASLIIVDIKICKGHT